MVELNIKVPKEFLDEEVRCNYTITKEMKEVWAVELDLLDQLLLVCKKHDIKIFASGGTMLGAIRHQGFIPWDDDIDMMMYRKDYEKLCKVAIDEFKFPYFFQTEYTDPGSLRGHAQLRNSKTTGILKSEIDDKFSFNQGIFLDIFPLDNVPDDDVLKEKQAKRIGLYKRRAFLCANLTLRYKRSKNMIKGIIKRFLSCAFGKIIREKNLEAFFYKKFEEECQKYNGIRTEHISTLSLDANNRQFYKRNDDYTELIEVPFEFMNIPVGKRYDHALRQRYGNYMEVVREGSYHGGVVFDAEMSYSEYLKLGDGRI